MDTNYLADLLYPNIKTLPADMEARYPRRQLPEGAKVTRFAPSPTGFVHFGGLFPSTVAERLAHQSGGVFYLRIEDTDAKREVAGAKDGLIKAAIVDGKYILGDANDDGKVSGLDAVAVLRYVAGLPNNKFNEQAANVNGDGKISGLDAVRLLRFIAFAEELG